MLSKILSMPEDSTAAVNDAVANLTENTQSEQRSTVSPGNLKSIDKIIYQTRGMRFGRWFRSIDHFGLGLVGTTMAKGILANEQGKIGWILLWALGVPIPLLFLLFLVRGCT